MRYEYVGGTSRKFWEVFPVDEKDGDYIVRVRFGRLGTAGQERIKVFTYQSAANRYRNEKIGEKERKGYKIKAEVKTQTGWEQWKGQPAAVLPPKPKPLCAHLTLMRKNGVYECTTCNKSVEFDKPQFNTATPEFEKKVRRYFDMSAAL